MNIYEQALGNLTEENWKRGEVADGNGNRCVTGHLLYVRYGRDMRWYETPDLNEEDFTLTLHKIIAEQYPAAVDAWLAGSSLMTVLSPIGLVTFFNDFRASYSDIRAVLEKAAANERA